MKLVYGHGINDVNAPTHTVVDGRRVTDPYYVRWRRMLTRAYCPKYHATRPTYVGVTVCDDWLRFSGFKSWMMEQDWEGKQLDKDILIPENKIYAPDRCLFVTQEINKLLNDYAEGRGKYPKGVSWDTVHKRYQVKLCMRGTLKHIGNYDTVEEASRAYRDAKSSHVREIADEQTEPLRSALHRHADRIQHD